MNNPLPGKILNVHEEGDNRIGLVEFDGKRRAIYLNLVPDAQVGDYVRFHAGFATERVAANSVESHYEQAEPSPGSEEQESIQGYRLLSELDPQQLRKLLPLAQDKRFGAGEIIFHSDERSLFLHLIVSGDVALEESSGERQVLVQTLHAGDAMGWSALTPGARTHFQARALSHVSTLAFPSDEICAACEEDPALGYALMKRLIELVTERLDVLRMKLTGQGEPEPNG